jgi:hypothetical protein
MRVPDGQPVVLTVVYSTPPLGEVIAFLAVHSVRRLINVRTVSRSGPNPQFNVDPSRLLPAVLEGAGIRYADATGLGGFAVPIRDPRIRDVGMSSAGSPTVGRPPTSRRPGGPRRTGDAGAQPADVRRGRAVACYRSLVPVPSVAPGTMPPSWGVSRTR